jgi:hypothetical protein
MIAIGEQKPSGSLTTNGKKHPILYDFTIQMGLSGNKVAHELSSLFLWPWAIWIHLGSFFPIFRHTQMLIKHREFPTKGLWFHSEKRQVS